jgi:hypothetical protein
LRLWALSLAHQQLSEVFWDKLVVEKGLAMNSPAILFATVGMWAGMTFGILMYGLFFQRRALLSSVTVFPFSFSGLWRASLHSSMHCAFTGWSS